MARERATENAIVIKDMPARTARHVPRASMKLSKTRANCCALNVMYLASGAAPARGQRIARSVKADGS